MNRLKKVFVLITILFTSSNITNAQEINIEEYGNSQQTEMVERKENDEMDNTNPNQSLRASRAALTVPKEGLSDRKQDIKNSSGIMIERRFFYKNVLVEKRLYTYSSANGYRMTTKHLYWSNGSTIERTRTYKYTAKNEIYIVNTKRYTAANKLDWHAVYDGTLSAKLLEGRYYDVTGTYYTYINYFKNNILSTRNYWKGSAPNRITSVVKYNVTGKEWTNATYYHDYNAKKISKVINYKATSPNYKLNEMNYLENGTKNWYIVYGENNNRHDLTYYNEDGTKDREIRYHKNSSVWDYEIQYQENNVRSKIVYRNTNNIVIKFHNYDEDDNIEKEIIFDETNNKISKENNFVCGNLFESLIYDVTGESINKSIKYNNGKVIEETKHQFGSKKDNMLKEYTKHFTDAKNDENGNLVASGTLKSTHYYMSDGKTSHYIISLNTDTGNIQTKIQYENGLLLKQDEYDEKGQYIESYFFEDKEKYIEKANELLEENKGETIIKENTKNKVIIEQSAEYNGEKVVKEDIFEADDGSLELEIEQRIGRKLMKSSKFLKFNIKVGGGYVHMAKYSDSYFWLKSGLLYKASNSRTINATNIYNDAQLNPWAYWPYNPKQVMYEKVGVIFSSKAKLGDNLRASSYFRGNKNKNKKGGKIYYGMSHTVYNRGKTKNGKVKILSYYEVDRY